MLTWFEVLGYTVLLEPEIVVDKHRAERNSYTDVVLLERLRTALKRINPHIPSEAIETVICQVTCPESYSLFENNCRFHKLLTDGVNVEYQANNQTIHDKVWLIDFSNLINNDWLAINQFAIIESQNHHSPDVVVFINGLPMAVMEWICPRDETATLHDAYLQLQTYTQDIPTLFNYNEILIISDGTQARVGTLTSDWEQFTPWHTIDGEDFPITGVTELGVLIQGIFDKRRFLDLVRYSIVFEVNGTTTLKKMTSWPFCTITTKNASPLLCAPISKLKEADPYFWLEWNWIATQEK